jgi:thioredoxin reductase (NADPH)
MEEAQFLTRFASKVTLLHRRDKFRASKTMLKRVMDNSKIEIRPFKRVNRWIGGSDGLLAGAEVADTRDGNTEFVPCEGGFIAIGHRPNTHFLGNQVELDEEGYIKTFRYTMTSKPGVFACGDVVDKRYRQAITAAGQGCAAALDCEKWLEEQAAEHAS